MRRFKLLMASLSLFALIANKPITYYSTPNGTHLAVKAGESSVAAAYNDVNEAAAYKNKKDQVKYSKIGSCSTYFYTRKDAGQLENIIIKHTRDQDHIKTQAQSAFMIGTHRYTAGFYSENGFFRFYLV